MELKKQPRTDAEAERQEQQLLALLNDIAEDARMKAERYPEETLVPEGGE